MSADTRFRPEKRAGAGHDRAVLHHNRRSETFAANLQQSTSDRQLFFVISGKEADVQKTSATVHRPIGLKFVAMRTGPPEAHGKLGTGPRGVTAEVLELQ